MHTYTHVSGTVGSSEEEMKEDSEEAEEEEGGDGGNGKISWFILEDGFAYVLCGVVLCCTVLYCVVTTDCGMCLPCFSLHAQKKHMHIPLI